MKYLDFEKHIKKELEGSKETVQMDALLASLDLGKQLRRKGFALWMIIPFLLIALSALAWKFMDSNQSDLNKPYLTEAVSHHKENTEAVLNTKNSIIGEANTSVIDNDSETLNETLTEVNENLNPTKRKVETSTTNNKISKSSITNNETTPATNYKPIIELQSTVQNQFGTEINSSDTKSSNTNSSYIMKDAFSSSKINDVNSASKPNTTLIRSRNELSIANLDKSIEILEDHEVDGNLFSRMKINCPSFDNAGWHLALVPEVGLFLPLKTLEGNSFEEADAYYERLNSESTLEGIELGLYGMLVRDNVPFYLKAGVSYSRISERMDLKYEYIEYDTIIGPISETVSENGDTITTVKGPIALETKFTGSNRQHHYIHLFDFPISIGYTTYIAGLDIGIEGGVKVNFMTRATGNLLTSKSEYTNLALNKLFKNKIGLSYFGGLMIGRNFGKFGDIFIAPRFTYYPNEFNNELNNVTQRYFTIGLNAGIVYKIN